MLDRVEVFELTPEEWDAIAQNRLDKLGLTALQLKEKHDANRLDTEEFKTWMIVSPSRLLD